MVSDHFLIRLYIRPFEKSSGLFIFSFRTKFDYIEWKYLAQPDEVLIINLLCVRPSMERCGIGKYMVRFIIEEAKSMNCKTVRLDTGRQNTPAIALYTDIGFELAGSNKNFLFYELKI